MLSDIDDDIWPTIGKPKPKESAEVVEEDPKFATMTVNRLVDDYLKFTSDTKYRSTKTHKENELQLAILKEALGSRLAVSITQSYAAKMAERVANRDRPMQKAKQEKAGPSDGMARAFIKAARKAYNWQLAREDDAAYANPFAFITKRPEIQSIMSSSVHVPHKLNDVEIAHVWKLLTQIDGPGSASVARALLMTLITGQRPGEVASMRSDEIYPSDYVSLHTGEPPVEGGWWVIPWQKRKMRRKKEKDIKVDHLVYLPPIALKVINNYDCPIFPSVVVCLQRTVGRHTGRQGRGKPGLAGSPVCLPACPAAAGFPLLPEPSRGKTRDLSYCCVSLSNTTTFGPHFIKPQKSGWVP